MFKLFIPSLKRDSQKIEQRGFIHENVTQTEIKAQKALLNLPNIQRALFDMTSEQPQTYDHSIQSARNFLFFIETAMAENLSFSPVLKAFYDTVGEENARLMLFMTGWLHDIGKSQLPEIITIDGPLDEEQNGLMKTHVINGAIQLNQDQTFGKTEKPDPRNLPNPNELLIPLFIFGVLTHHTPVKEDSRGKFVINNFLSPELFMSAIKNLDLENVEELLERLQPNKFIFKDNRIPLYKLGQGLNLFESLDQFLSAIGKDNSDFSRRFKNNLGNQENLLEVITNMLYLTDVLERVKHGIHRDQTYNLDEIRNRLYRNQRGEIVNYPRQCEQMIILILENLWNETHYRELLGLPDRDTILPSGSPKTEAPKKRKNN